MRTNSRRLLATLLGVALLATTAACGSSDSNTTQSDGKQSDTTQAATKATGPAPKTLRLATTASITSLPLLVMEGNGALDKIGNDFNTNITLDTSLGSGDITTAFAAGQFDIMFQGIQHAPTLLAKGQDAVELMSIAAGGGVYIVGSSKHKDRGTDLRNWTGSTFGDSGVGSQTELWLDALMQGGGVSKYKKTPLTLDALYPTMLAGRIDGYAADAGTAAPAIVNKTGYVIADSNSPAAAKLFGDLAPTVSLVTTHKFTRAYPELTQALVTGLLSELKTLSKPDMTAEKVRAQLSADNPYKKDAKNFGAIWDLLIPAFRNETGVYTKKRNEAVVRLLRESKVIKADQTPPASMTDNSFVLKAYDALKLTPPPGVSGT
jgi:ABC-type nitrate/sulfonate/bicarbonate transport system substrate-binding protein